MRKSHRSIFPRFLRHAFTRTLAIALSILLSVDTAAFALPGFGSLGGAFAGPKATPAPAPQRGNAQHGNAQREKVASQLDALADLTQRIANQAPRDHDDPGVVLAKTGKDPAAIVNWVRSNTREIAYVGMLRGPSGVLMDRAGNSLDRSLLLADLLRREGYEVRLARAQLDPKIAAALMARVEASVPKQSPPPPLDRAELLKQFGNDPRLDHAMVEKAVDRTVAGSQRFENTLKGLYSKVYPSVIQAVGNDPQRDQRLAADMAAALRDHFWVQRHVTGGWEDLDPDADVVHKLTPEAVLAPEQLPDALKHRVTVRVILETWSAGKLSETKLLERTWTPSDLMGKPVTLGHALFPDTPIDQIADQPNAQDKYLDGLTRAWVIQPVLRVGKDTVTDKLYTLRGQVLPAGPATISSLGVGGIMNTQPLQGVLGAFGAKPAASSGPPDESTAPVRVTAEWIEFQIDCPGRPAERHRRSVFDLIGPAARLARQVPQPPSMDASRKRLRTLALSGSVDIYIFGATPADEWITRQSAQALSDFARTTAQYERSGARFSEVVNSAQPTPLLLPLWTWAFARSASAMVPTLAPVQPNIALLWQEAAPQSTGVNAQLEFDVVSNNVGGTPKFSDRLAQGVLDTVTERAIFDSPDQATNAAALQATDLAAGRRWLTLDKAAGKRLTTLALTDDAKARIRSELESGNVVIAPNEPIVTPAGKAIAWWRVDPNTGLTLGIGADGRGAEMAEEAFTQKFVAGASVCAFVAVGRQLATGGGNIYQFLACVVAAGMGAEHMTMNAVYGHATLELVLGVFEMIHDMGHGGHE